MGFYNLNTDNKNISWPIKYYKITYIIIKFKAIKEMHLEHQKESSICKGKYPESHKQTASLSRVQLSHKLR